MSELIEDFIFDSLCIFAIFFGVMVLMGAIFQDIAEDEKAEIACVESCLPQQAKWYAMNEKCICTPLYQQPNQTLELSQ